MATCPNKNSKEWKEVLSEAQNNDKLAMELWVAKGYNNISSINQEDTSDVVTDEDKKEFNTEEKSEASEKTDLGKLVDRTKVHLERRIKLLKLVKTKDNTVQQNKIRKLLNDMEKHQEDLDEVASKQVYATTETGNFMGYAVKHKSKYFLHNFYGDRIDIAGEVLKASKIEWTRQV